MEISKKHWTVKLIKLTYGSDVIYDIRDTCEYRKKLIWSFILLPLSLICLPVTLVLRLICKEWIGLTLSFISLLLLFTLFGAGYILINMWSNPSMLPAGITICIGITIGLLIGGCSYIKNTTTIQDLIKSWKDKYCEPIDFK